MANSSVRLAGGLPDGDKNGLAAIAHMLVDRPDEMHVAIVLLDCSKLLTSVDDGSVLPTARIRAIEPVSESADSAELKRLLRRQHERRTGATELPLELERALDDLGLGDDAAPRVADHAERAAGEREDPLAPSPDSPLPAPDDVEAPADPLAPPPDTVEPATDLDAPDADDELSADDPRRGPLPSGGLFREPPAQPAGDDDQE